MTEACRQALKKSIVTHGLVETLVWNRRSGNLIGGHQRLREIDGLEGGQNYRITVAAVEVDDAGEKQLNIILNNPNAQGDWDLAALEKLLDEVDLEATGFTRSDIFHLFGDEVMVFQSEAVEQLAAQLRDAQERYASIRKASRDRNETEYYGILVFKDNEQRARFCRSIGMKDDNRWINGDLALKFAARRKQR